MLKLFTIVTLLSAMVWPSEAKSWSYSSWIGDLKDQSQLITQISIPGTHDSATDWDHCIAESGCNSWRWFASCQTYNIPTQFKKGIRFFDIRLAYENGILRFHHSIYYLGQDFDYAIDHAQTFLNDNPSEFVIFLIKQEHTSESADTFWERAHDVYFDKSEYDGLFYLEKRVPTVEEARGKIIIMGRESSYHLQGYRVHWDKNTSHYEGHDGEGDDLLRYIVEDHYSFSNILSTHTKEKKLAWIAQNLYLAGMCATCGYQKTLFITFLSAEGDPISTRTPRDYADYENLHTAAWLYDRPGPRPGIVAIDLAGDPDHHGDTVIKEVINQNTFE